MSEFIRNIKFSWEYTKSQKKQYIKYSICHIFSFIISVIAPILSAKAIVYLTDNALYQLTLVAISIFLIENVRNVIKYCCRYYSQEIYREAFINIQTTLGKEILRLENQVIDANGTGVFIERLSNDTRNLADVFNILNIYLTRIIISLGMFCAVFAVNKIIFIYLVFAVALLYIVESIRVKKRNEKDKLFRKEAEGTSGFVGEIVRGVRDIKMLNAEDGFVETLHQKVLCLNQKRYAMVKVDREYHLLNGFLRDLNDLLLILLMVYMIYNHQIVVASALIIRNYSVQIPSIIDNIGVFLEKIKEFNLSASRIYAIIDSDEFKKETFGKKHLEKIEGNFSFQHVSFMYDKKEENVLNDISFEVKANETVAFVGKSGAGKSTIFHLLCKIYDIDNGTITIDGINIKELDKDSIRGNITIISQNPYIFNVSIMDNFKLVKRDVTEIEVKEACKMACLDEFIETLPKKYDTLIGEGGVNLSGGQRQRLAIARALVQKTEIILFDEATSALDNETQKSIQRAIDNMKNEYTILIIAHRLSTIINSDRILFLNHGTIEASGTHEELLKNNLEYKRLYEAESENDDNN